MRMITSGQLHLHEKIFLEGLKGNLLSCKHWAEAKNTPRFYLKMHLTSDSYFISPSRKVSATTER